MKKLVFFVALMLGMSTATFATDENAEATNAVEAYSFNTNAKSLVRYLDLNEDQASTVMETQRAFENAMRMASVMDGEGREKMVKNAIDFDLKHMKYILTDKQYKKYRLVLNTSLRNRNIR